MANIAIPRKLPTYKIPGWRRFQGQARRYPLVPLAIILLVLVIPAVLANFIAPHSPTVGSLSSRLQPPIGSGAEVVQGVTLSEAGSWAHPLGTDKQGRDILSRIIYGARVSLTVASISIIIAGIIGTTLGLIAGYFGGNIDHFIMRLVDIALSIPGILLALVLAVALGPSFQTVIIVIVVVFWSRYARLVRGETLSIKSQDFVNRARVAGANDTLRVGVAGLNSRGWGHVEQLRTIEGTRVVALCDPDRRILARCRAELEKQNETVATFTDIRALLDGDTVDVVFVAAPDHWHALAGVWAMQAGKDVYIEKPLTYCIAEGPRLVEAAQRYGRIAQTGSQHRSCPATHKIRDEVQGGKLGQVRFAYAQVFNRRKSIGKAKGPLTIPPEVDYDLYAGPASPEPPVRERLHYDWHWQWPMGTGETGNWGAHIIDDALNITGLTEAPRSAVAVGGRFGYDDDGETPNTLLVAYDTGRFPLVAQFRALPMRPGLEAMDHFRGIRIGTVIECEKGYYAGGRGGGWIYDLDGNRVEPVEGDGGSAHVQNFLDAVRSREPGDLNAPMQAGHVSALHCHLGNMSYRLGRKVPAEVAAEAMETSPLAGEQFSRMLAHLAAHGIDTSAPTLVLGDTIRMDPGTDTCIGPNADAANALARGTWRGPFTLDD